MFVSYTDKNEIFKDAIHLTDESLTSYAASLKNDKNGWASFVKTASGIIAQLKKNLLTAHNVIEAQRRTIMELEKTADTDCLTGLANRRRFERAFKAEIERVNRKKSKGGLLVMIDLDNFKQINDKYGHQVGDACLRKVANLLKREVRSLDLAARLGGDEFVLLFSDAESDVAIDRTQRIAIELNKLTHVHEGVEIEIRASVGLRNFSAEDKIEDIIRDADDTLYQDKEKKKKALNQTVKELEKHLFKGEKISVLTLHQ